MFLGGLTMLVTGFLELYRHNSLGATAFCTYGAFWIAVGELPRLPLKAACSVPLGCESTRRSIFCSPPSLFIPETT
jgi:succinate-acetate transporter protein